MDEKRAPLFRFPYGARNAEGMQMLSAANLKSIMWNVDSLDWADPVPDSIAQRVLDGVDKQGRGIVLFHDIHERTVKALPQILDRLTAEGYQFAAWNGRDFTVRKAARNAESTATVPPATAAHGRSSSASMTMPNGPKLSYAATMRRR